jgi:hypothetical protein
MEVRPMVDLRPLAGGSAVQPLAGDWRVAPDPENEGHSARWFAEGPVDGAAPAAVPGILQQSFPGYRGVV